MEQVALCRDAFCRDFPVSCCVAGVECAGKPQEGLSQAGFSVCVCVCVFTTQVCLLFQWRLFIVLKDLFYVHECLPARTSVRYVYPWCLQYSEEDAVAPGTEITGGCKQSCRLPEQQVPLTAEPPLQPLRFSLN